MQLVYSTTAQTVHLNGVKVAIYGPASSGKTLILATAPKPMIASAENGLLSLNRQNIARVYGPATAGISYDIPYTRIETVEQLAQFYEDMKHPQNPYQTICLDSASEIAETILTNAKLQIADGRQAYGAMAEQMFDLLRKFRDMPGKNVVFTFKQGLCKSTGLFSPWCPGQLLDDGVPYIFDEIFQMAMNESNVRYLRTTKDYKHEAKDRSGMLAPEGEYPHLGMIFQKIAQAGL